MPSEHPPYPEHPALPGYRAASAPPPVGPPVEGPPPLRSSPFGDDAASVAPEAPHPVGARRRRRLSRSRRRVVAALGVLAFLVAPAVAGYEVGRDRGAAVDPSAASIPSTGDAGGSGGRSGGGDPAASTDLGDVADDVDDVVVNVNTTVDGGGQAAGTGIVIAANGAVLTNHHVISGATAITVEFAATGATRPAKVLGYSVLNDVAVIQVQNVRDLDAADIGSSSSLDIGETILALGNAGGTGGTPTITAGTVTALDREITASDADGSNAKTLEGLIELAADIRSGDSGGPVVDADGDVVGLTVAASVSNSFGFPGAAGQGYAIPIEDAIAIAKRILSGEGGEGIRVGATRGVLGVQIQPTLTAQRSPNSGGSGSGARIVGVEEGSGADDAGLETGDVIIEIEGRTITTTDDLMTALVAYDPGESIEVTVRSADGDTRTVDVELGEAPPG